jgi:nicotinate dehydrogenase subunit A
MREAMPTYSCRVNGRAATLHSWDPDQPLLYALRSSLGLTGTRVGCGLGQCGTCTVLLDDQAVRSCMVPTNSVAGRRVTTIEGLGTAEKPDRVQAAFIAEQAAQCGYCVPGILVALVAVLERTRSPSDAEVTAALAGHLCRCGAHPRMLRAVRRAAEELAP